MSPRTKFHLGGGLLALAAVLLLLWAHLARRRVETALAEVTGQRAALIMDARRSAAANTAEALKTVLAPAPSPARPGTGARPSPFSTLMSDARLQTSYFAARRANLASTYGPLLRSLHLSSDESKALEDRIMERDEQFFDIVSAVPDAIHSTSYGGTNPFLRNPFLITSDSEDGQPVQASTPDGQAAAELLRQNDASFKDSATALLGPAGYQQLLQYERMLPVRDVVNSLGSSVAASGAPLNSAQADELTQILANSSPTYQQGGVARGGNGVDWNRALTQAAQVLSPEQLAALQAQVGPIQSMRQLRDAVIEAGGLGDTAKLVHAVTGKSD